VRLQRLTQQLSTKTSTAVLGQNKTLAGRLAMSALPSKADIVRARRFRLLCAKSCREHRRATLVHKVRFAEVRVVLEGI
jgi:hypothetical protein